MINLTILLNGAGEFWGIAGKVFVLCVFILAVVLNINPKNK
jgi:hypothetical protein